MPILARCFSKPDAPPHVLGGANDGFGRVVGSLGNWAEKIYNNNNAAILVFVSSFQAHLPS